MLETDFEDYDIEVTSRPRVRAKVCMVGDGGVGKTSLVRRFVLEQFDDKYIRTIGTKVSKKSIMLYDKHRDRETEVILTIWDIMGQEGFRDLLQESYFCGANGILAVCDAANDDTMNKLDGWLDRTYRVAGDVPVSILVNKIDLKDRRTIDEETLRQFGRAYDCPLFYTSARTGDCVEKTFTDIALRILHGDSREKERLIIP